MIRNGTPRSNACFGIDCVGCASNPPRPRRVNGHVHALDRTGGDVRRIAANHRDAVYDVHIPPLEDSDVVEYDESDRQLRLAKDPVTIIDVLEMAEV